jgi:ketosteroid isomerase-like protein
MAEQQIKSIMRDYIKVLAARDVEKALSFFAEDATLVAPDGTFKGKGELKRYLTRMGQVTPDLKVTETGIKIMVQGNTGVYEHVLSGTSEGMKWEALAMCVYEFTGDKIQNLREVYDRLLIAKQTVKGMLAKKAVNSIVNAFEKGLR